MDKKKKTEIDEKDFLEMRNLLWSTRCYLESKSYYSKASSIYSFLMRMEKKYNFKGME